MQDESFVFLAIHQVIAMVGLGKTEIYKRIKAVDFPAPVVLGDRCVRWRSDEIQAWMKAKSAHRAMPTNTSSAADTPRQARAKKAVNRRHEKRKANMALIGNQPLPTSA